MASPKDAPSISGICMSVRAMPEWITVQRGRHAACPSLQRRPRPPRDARPSEASCSARIRRFVALSSTIRTRTPRTSGSGGAPARRASGLACQDATVKQNVRALALRAFARQSSPPIISASAWRWPAPAPCRRTVRVVEASTCLNGLKSDARSCPAGMPMPVSRTAKRSSALGRRVSDSSRDLDHALRPAR